jgi:PAS domain S-box-containing protein
MLDKFFPLLLDSYEEAIGACDAQFVITDWNLSLERMTGLSAKEAVGQSVFALFPFLSDSGPKELLDRAMRGEEITLAPQPFRVPQTGKEGLYLGKYVPLRDGSGPVQGLFGIIRDVTYSEHIATLQSLLLDAGTRLFRARDVTEIAFEGTQMLVPSLADWSVIVFEPQRMLGPLTISVRHAEKTREPLLSEMFDEKGLQLFASMVGDAPRLLARSECKQPSLDEVTPRQLELLEAIGGRSMISIPLVVRDRVIGRLITAKNKSDFCPGDFNIMREFAGRLSLAADNYWHFARAAAAVSAREEIMAIVSHDLRNPLATIQLRLAGLARAAKGSPLEAEVTEAAALIKKVTERAVDLISTLLDASRIQQGSLPLNATLCKIVTLVSEAIEHASVLAQTKNLKLHQTIDAPINLEVGCDVSRILQVLSNLLSNAVKFSPEGGTIDVAVSERNGRVLVAVSDAGDGIPAEQLNLIFEKHWQVRDKQKNRTGLGLGLFVAKGIIDAHGGHIWAENIPNAGARISFELPVERPELKERAPDSTLH